MPKMKTKSGAAKRFKVRAGGSVKRSQAFKRHILTRKPRRASASYEEPSVSIAATWRLCAQ